SSVPVIGETRARSILRGDPPNLIVPPLACRFHPRCPVAFEVCGWSPEEVAEDLEFLVGGKYYGTFGDGVSLTVEGDRTIIIRGTTEVQRIRELVDLEREDVRSLKSIDRKSTRLNSSHGSISYAVFCLKKKNINCSV